jgi:hypothetical protein
MPTNSTFAGRAGVRGGAEVQVTAEGVVGSVAEDGLPGPRVASARISIFLPPTWWYQPSAPSGFSSGVADAVAITGGRVSLSSEEAVAAEAVFTHAIIARPRVVAHPSRLRRFTHALLAVARLTRPNVAQQSSWRL